MRCNMFVEKAGEKSKISSCSQGRGETRPDCTRREELAGAFPKRENGSEPSTKHITDEDASKSLSCENSGNREYRKAYL